MPIDERERERRRNLVRAHYKAENNHDLEGIMKTFSPEAVMHYNRREFPSDDTIRWAHGYIGMTAAPGAFGGLETIIDEEHFTDTETVIEGRRYEPVANCLRDPEVVFCVEGGGCTPEEMAFLDPQGECFLLSCDPGVPTGWRTPPPTDRCQVTLLRTRPRCPRPAAMP